MLCAAQQIKSRLDDLVQTASIHDGEPWNVSSKLYATIANQFEVVSLLIRHNFIFDAFIIVRSMTEGFVDLLTIIDNPEYINEIKYYDEHETCKLFISLQEKSKTSNDANAQTKPDHEPKDRKNKHRLPTIHERLGKINRSEIYPLYKFLCQFSHNQFASLLARHEENIPQNKFSAVALDAAIKILCQAFQKLHAFTNVSDSKINQAIEYANETWEQVYAGP